MTISEAKKRVLEYLDSIPVDNECPLIWVGEFLKEDATHIWIEGTNYADVQNPKDVAIPYWVNKKTGKVMIGVELK